MKALALKSILASVAQLTGVSSRQISPEQHAAMVVAVSEALKTVWNEYPWPELCDTQRYVLWPAVWTPASALDHGDTVRLTRGGVTSYWTRTEPKAAGVVGKVWDIGGSSALASVSYGTNKRMTSVLTAGIQMPVLIGDFLVIGNPASPTYAEVLDTRVLTTGRTEFVLSTAASFGGSTQISLPYYPGSSPVSAEWTSASMPRYTIIPDTIGKVTAAWDRDPTTEGSKAKSIAYALENSRVYFGDGVNEAWLETVAAELELDGTFWDPAENAVVGMMRYSDAGGDCFLCILDKAGDAANPRPEADATYWTRVQIPALLAPPTKYLASAEILRADGKETTAIARERKADDALERALQSVNEHQHQTARWGVKA